MGLNGLYLNLAGRERNGIVAPADSESLINDLISRLRAFKDPETGQAAVDTVYVTRREYQGGKALDGGPDLMVGYRPGYRASWQTVLGAVPEKIVEPNTDAWIGDHCIAAHFVPGVLLSNRRGARRDARLADLPVTIIREFNVNPDPAMKGRKVFSE